MSLKVNRINQQSIDSTIQAASDASIDRVKQINSQRSIDPSQGAGSNATVRHGISTDPSGTKNYNSLVNKPIINADLNFLDPAAIILNIGYRHTGESNEIFIKDKLYFFDDSWHELGNYEGLINLPTINGVSLIGALTGENLGITNILYNTTAFGDSHIDIRSERNTLYIYTDKFSYQPSAESPDIIVVEGIKIGDGNAYLIDKPFITDAISFALNQHINDSTVHVSQTERNVGNNKLNYKDPGQTDLLEFTRN